MKSQESEDTALRKKAEMRHTMPESPSLRDKKKG